MLRESRPSCVLLSHQSSRAYDPRAGGQGGGNLARFPSVPNALPSADLDQLLQQHHEGVRVRSCHQLIARASAFAIKHGLQAPLAIGEVLSSDSPDASCALASNHIRLTDTYTYMVMWHDQDYFMLAQGVMSPSPSGALGDQQYRQLSMGRMPSMGMGKLESMELPDAVAAVAMLHDMPAEQQRGAAGGGGGGGTSASAQADAAKQPAEDGGGPPASNGLAADGRHVRGCCLRRSL